MPVEGNPVAADYTPCSACPWVIVSDLAQAFSVIGEVNPRSVTLVTDGEPTDEDAAYDAAITLHCPVNILFVGTPGDEAALSFCRRVCAATGGTFATQVLDVVSLAQTTATVKHMLGDGQTTPTAIPLGGTPT